MQVKRKVCFVGSENVGKTAIINQYTTGEFRLSYNPTIGVDFISKTIQMPGGICKMQIWDTAGQSRFVSLIPSYLKDSDTVFLVFDITDENGLHKVAKFAQFIHQSQKENSVYLIGNKLDSENDRKISQEVGMAFCEQHKFQAYIEISAAQHSDVTQLFNRVLSDLLQGGQEVTEAQEKNENKEIPEEVKVQVQEIKEEAVDEKSGQEEVPDKLKQLGLCQETIEYLNEQRIDYQILEYMNKQDIKGLKIVIGDQFRIIKKLCQ